MRRSWMIIWVALVSSSVGSEPVTVKSAIVAPDLDALFENTDGWIGGDGAYSVMLAPNKTVWLFSDTWVGKVRDGRRTEATIVNNTVAVQEESHQHATFHIERQSDEKPTALFVPTDGRGWFWLQAGAADRGRMFVFLNQVEKTDDKSVFGFRSIGLWLATVTNADAPPDSWRIEQVKMPNTEFSNDRILVWGAAVQQVGDDLYVYGTDERRGKVFPHRHMVVARVPAEAVSDFTQWRYFCSGTWSEDFRNPTHLIDQIASEYSVTRQGNRYLAVYTENGLSPRILCRSADNPWGPWSTPTVIFQCPEMEKDKNLFCYAAKAHSSLSTDDELVVSYVVNSFDFWQVARESQLYWPRFVRVALSPSK